MAAWVTDWTGLNKGVEPMLHAHCTVETQPPPATVPQHRAARSTATACVLPATQPQHVCYKAVRVHSTHAGDSKPHLVAAAQPVVVECGERLRQLFHQRRRRGLPASCRLGVQVGQDECTQAAVGCISGPGGSAGFAATGSGGRLQSRLPTASSSKQWLRFAAAVQL